MTIRFYAIISLTLLSFSAITYADSAADVNQGNSNADSIAAQAQTRITQQQQLLAQRLQALSAAMQAQNPNVLVVAQPIPKAAPVQAVEVPPVKSPLATPPQETTTTEANATGLAPPSANKKADNRNQWDYGF